MLSVGKSKNGETPRKKRPVLLAGFLPSFRTYDYRDSFFFAAKFFCQNWQFLDAVFFVDRYSAVLTEIRMSWIAGHGLFLRISEK